MADIVLKDVANYETYVDILGSIICRSESGIICCTTIAEYHAEDFINSMIFLSDAEYDNFIKILSQARLMNAAMKEASNRKMG